MSIFNKFDLSNVTSPSSRLEIPDLRTFSTSSSIEVTVKTKLEANDKYYFEVLENGSVIFSDTVIGGKEVSKIPHEMISKLFFGESSDRKMSTIEVIHDNTDLQTPDHMIPIDADSVLLVEIKTQRKPVIDLDKFNSTLEIYKSACEKRSSKKFLLCALIVSPLMVTTNLPINSSEANQLSSIYQIGQMILNSFRDLGWCSYDLDIEYKINDLKRKLSVFSPPDTSDDPLIITKEKIRHWRTVSEQCANKYLVKEFIKSRDEAIIETSVNNREIAETMVNEFVEPIRVGKMTMKSPIQLPLSLNFSYESTFHDLNSIEVRDTISKIWKQASSYAILNPENWYEIPVPELLSYSLKDADELMKTPKEDKFRVSIELENQEWVELAKHGIEAKHYKKHPEIMAKRRDNQIPISFDCETDDIDSFVKNKELLNHSSITNPMSPKLVSLLSMSGDNELSIEFCEKFFSTNLGVSLTQLQAILTEVNISRLQNCKKHVFVLKWCAAASVFILIKPTKASEQIFFSIATHVSNISYGRPFKETRDYGNWKISDFVSMDTNRLSHQIAAPERACALLAFWCHQFSVLPLEFFSTRDKDVSEHFLASVLFYMEDKENTSSTMQVLRYAYMELVKGPNREMSPFKVLKKMSDRPRSRLAIWAVRRFITSFNMMIDKPLVFGLRESDDLANETSQDVVQNLISWVTLRSVRKFENCLNLCYFGVLHNKEEGDKVAGFLKIFEKVLQEEILLRKANPRFMGNEEPPADHAYQSHEFSPSLVAKMGRTVKKYLSSKGGSTMKWCTDKVYETLVQKDILEYATMKSSAEPMNPDAKYTTNLEMNKRKRTSEAVKGLLDEGISPSVMLDIDRIESKVSYAGGIQSNLFKKMQIGGTREIFVLTIESRILISFCETTCRTLCEELPNEMLTKGDQKMLRNDTHFKTTNKIPGNFTTTVSSSDDATTWAQKFVMNAFACFLCNIFDDDIMNLLAVILNHCTNKRLELPWELLDLFRLHTGIDSFSPNINELKEQFSGRSPNSDLVDKDSCYLKNRSNMMQGIFHYTSSLYHSGFLLLWSDFSSKIIESSLNTIIRSHVITTKVSSDDSSVLISTRFKNHEDRVTINRVFYSLTKLKEKMYPYFCCKQSVEKSTVGVFWTIEEFNSTWLMRNTIITPLIKFIVAATQIHNSPKLESRLFTSSTLRSQILENCGSMMVASIVQVCQARLHYLALGAMNNKLWLHFQQELVQKPHHTCGFMPMEPDLTCGMLGINHAMYRFYKRNAVAGGIQSRLFRNMGSDYSKDCAPTSRVFISYGHNSKYYAFLRSMGLSNKKDEIMSIEQKLDPIVEMLYRPSRDTEETKIKLLIKASDPELSQAFSFLNSSRTFATASYMLQEPCMHLMSGIDDDGAMKFSKCSLMHWIMMISPDEPALSEPVLRLNFPSWKLYDILETELKSFNLRVMDMCYEKRRIFVSIPIPKQSSLTPLSLTDACRRMWFNHDVRGSRAAVEATYLYFKEIYPWLSTNYEETLMNSPFNSHIMLHKFLLSMTPISKSIRLTTTSRIKQSGLMTILDSVKWNQFPSHVVVTNENDEQKSSEYIMDSFVQSIWRIKSAPPIRDKNYLISKLCKAYPDLLTDNPNVVDIMTQGKMRFNALILQCAVINPGMVIPLLVRFNKGVFGGFTSRQKFDAEVGQYVGHGTYSGSIDGAKFTMFIKDDEVTKVIVMSRYDFLLRAGTFNWFIRDMGLSLNCKRGSSMEYYNGTKMLGYWSESCCKLVEGDVIHNWENKGVTFDCDSRGRIRIRTDEERPITILSFIPSVRHILTVKEVEAFMSDEIMNCWIWDRSLSHTTGYKLITTGSKTSEMNEWIVRSLLKRLDMKGYQIRMRNMYKNACLEESDVSEDEDVKPNEITENLHRMLENDDFDDDELFEMLKGDGDCSSDDDYEYEMEDYGELAMFSDDYISRQPIKSEFESDALSMSRFWDDTINYLIDLSSFLTIERAVNYDNIINPSLLPVREFINEMRKEFSI